MSPERAELIKRLYAEGVPLIHIGTLVGMQGTRVRKILDEMGVERRSRATVFAHLRERNGRPSRADLAAERQRAAEMKNVRDQKLLDLYDASDLSIEEIAHEVGVSTGLVRKVAKQHGRSRGPGCGFSRISIPSATADKIVDLYTKHEVHVTALCERFGVGKHAIIDLLKSRAVYDGLQIVKTRPTGVDGWRRGRSGYRGASHRIAMRT